MSAGDQRAQLAAAQADLVRCLVGGGPVPRGFDAERLRAASTALLDKRARLAARALPRTALYYGAGFAGRFTDWARTHPLRRSAHAGADGVRFLRGRPHAERLSWPADVVVEWVSLELGACDRHVSVHRSSGGLVVGLRAMGEHTMIRSRRQPMDDARPVRVSRRTPCAIDATGVTLHRWPGRSVHVPLERVDRFEVIREVNGDGYDRVERLALLTREGEILSVSRWLNSRRAPTKGGRAQQLNNELVRARRASGPQDRANSRIRLSLVGRA